MKKIFLLASMASVTLLAAAQDIDDIRKFAVLGQNDKAKEAVDKYLSIEKNAKKPEGWFWKAYILNTLSKDSTKSIDQSSAMKTESFETFKKYREMDPKAALLTEDNNASIYNLYESFGAYLAVKAYQEKNFASSFENFKKALEVHDYAVANNISFSNGYKFSQLDTLFTQYAAISANDAKKTDDAAIYHKKLVDAGLNGDTYADSYNFLVDYYKNKKDIPAFNDILAKAKKEYPKNNRYWTAVEIELYTEGVAKPAVFSKYDELVAKYPESYDIAYNYAAELFNYINSDGANDPNIKPLKAKLNDVLKKAIAINSTFDANFVQTVSMYNNSFDLTDEAAKIKGAKPDDQKKKKALQDEGKQVMNDAIPYGENGIKAFATLAKPTLTEKANYRKLVTMMKNIYEVKKDTAKTAEYDKLVKSAE